MGTDIEKFGNQPWSFNEELDTFKSFQAFVVFRDLAGNRTLPEVARLTKRNLSLVQSWSSLANWTERARAYDKYIDSCMIDRALKLSVDSHVDKLQKYRKLHENLGFANMEIANQCLAIANKALEKYIDNPDLDLRPVDIKMITTAGISSVQIGSQLLNQALAVEKLLDSLPVENDIDVEVEEVD